MAKSRARELRDTAFGINDHFPMEINEKGKKISHPEREALPEPTSLLGDG
jgi:hypothetical protein